MITIAVTKAYAIVTSRELLTSGMSNVAQVAFTFSSDWEGLNKTAVWTDGTVTVDVSDASWSNNICNIPHEVLTTSGRIVRVGIYGTDGSTTVLPTIWAEIGRVRGGADPSGDPSVTPTPTVQAQLLAAASAAGQAKTDALDAQSAAESAKTAATQQATNATNANTAAQQAKADAQAAASTATAAAAAMQECAAYSSTKAYAVGNMATYNGSTYRCTTACTGVVPTTTSNWLLIAAKGTDGQDAGDMLKSTYDTNNNGKVDNAEALDGHAASYFVPANTAITGATHTKVTYDAKGLVTGGADATTADIADSTNRRYCTDAQKTVISNTSGKNTGDQNAAGVNISDAGGYFTGTTVETALQEIGSTLNGLDAELEGML